MAILSSLSRLLLVLALLAPMPVARTVSAQEDGDQPSTTIITSTPTDLPPRVRSQFERYLKDLPAGTRVRVSLGEFFDFGHSSSTDQMEPFIQSIAPVDDKDLPHGLEAYFDTRSASPTRTVPWVHGVKDGPEKHYAQGDKSRYVVDEIPWAKGEIHGVRKSFHPDGSLRSETTYLHNVQHGSSRAYGTAGTLTREATMKKGNREGRMTDYWPGTEQVKRSIDYRNGLVDGWMREYYLNGQLKREIPFKQDRMHGIERELAQNGKPVRTRYWVEGDAVPEAVFKQRFK